VGKGRSKGKGCSEGEGKGARLVIVAELVERVDEDGDPAARRRFEQPLLELLD
jgi:hypothetical protein